MRIRDEKNSDPGFGMEKIRSGNPQYWFSVNLFVYQSCGSH
jgi:hypothetical protein